MFLFQTQLNSPCYFPPLLLLFFITFPIPGHYEPTQYPCASWKRAHPLGTWLGNLVPRELGKKCPSFGLRQPHVSTEPSKQSQAGFTTSAFGPLFSAQSTQPYQALLTLIQQGLHKIPNQDHKEDLQMTLQFPCSLNFWKRHFISSLRTRLWSGKFC